MTFNELNLSAPLLRAVSEAGYETPSPIQASAIPPVLEGRDLMGCAQTGTGKTAAFALPMLDRLSGAAPRRKGAIRALILTPTRELALQIGESFAAYGKYLKLRSTVIFGGAQQVGVAHGVQRQDKAALAVAEGEGVVLVRFAPAVSLSVGPVHLDLGVVVGGVGKDAAPLDLQLKEEIIGRCIVEFSVINGVYVAVFAVAAPV